MNLFRINARIIRVLNSCKWDEFNALVVECIDIPKIFTSKRYVWNIIRGRDFYKMLAHLTIESIQNGNMELAEKLIRVVMTTAKTNEIKLSFTRAIVKILPLITIDTIPYISTEKLRRILRNDLENASVIADDTMKPILLEIIDLKKQILSLEEQIKLMQEIMQ